MSKAKNMKSVALILITLVLFNTISIDAQDESVRFAGFTRGLYNKEWSSDGQRLAFQEPATSEGWYVANPNTGELEEFDEYPFSADLTNAEEQAFPTEDVRRTSPDEQLLLYSVSLGPSAPLGMPYQFVLANRSTQQILDTNIPAIEVNIHEFFDFFWSQDGLNVTTSNISIAGTRLIYSVIIPESRNLDEAIIYEFDSILIDNGEFYLTDSFINRLLAVSSTGQYVLLTAQEEDSNLASYDQQTYLVMWNPQNASLSRLFALGDTRPTRFITGAFSPLSEDQTFVWEDDFSILGGRILFYENVDATPIELMELEDVFSPKFSPDGEWFSYSTDGELVFIRTEDLIPNE